ncbi:probable transporter Seo1p [[Candida] anglica]|uniref:Probable transporter Seo1p n=1 Tax=[Candida] anglica TaxID=148631 RepID=A0ABP0EF22_9ASCO
MVKLPWWIPQERNVPETKEEIDSAYKNRKVEDVVIIREYRDEAKRPWWKFFDEFEYRKDVPKWSWLGTGASPQERKLLLKLDAHIVIYAMLGYWIKFLDTANLTNAYVSGMKEDVGMFGNDLIDTQVLFQVAAILFGLPLMYLIPRYPTTYILFISELVWSLFTLVTFATPNVPALKGFRFMVGGFEAAYFPIIHYTLSNYYKPSEISSRASIFYCGQYLGVLTAGLLQSVIYDTLNGVHGLQGWKWMFIIDGILSFTVAFLGLFLMPGTPFKCYSIILSDDDIKLCRKRMRENGTDGGEDLTNFLDWPTWKKMLQSWHFWIMSIAGIGGFNANNTTMGSFALWLKSENRFSIGKLNQLTAIPPALGIVYVIFTCFGADITQKRFLMVIFAQLMNLIGCVILTVWDVAPAAKWFAFYFGYWSWAQSSVFYPILNDILRHDANLKAIEWQANYLIGQQSYAWISRIIWPTTDAPRFKNGFLVAGLMGMIQAVFMAIGYFFYKRDERSRAASEGIVVYNSAKGELHPATNINSGSDSEEINDEKHLEKVAVSETKSDQLNTTH